MKAFAYAHKGCIAVVTVANDGSVRLLRGFNSAAPDGDVTKRFPVAEFGARLVDYNGNVDDRAHKALVGVIRLALEDQANKPQGEQHDNYAV